ncbi:3-phosphoserine/phosphohydroxythreonine transaminase [Actinospica robiniae]|uniref:3-phosphoserine/phosphohydroxythreonine transaminase n=1 Tax=Actinospica robiniae TaxID=304901 RepID=UPI0005589257|nr:3-phosphoserine/phosphohydroxythreonine transaminase [Actinospica robiniae]
MPSRPISFSPGPSMLPDEVLAKYVAQVTSYRDFGLGILELGHRTRQFEDLFDDTIDLLRTLLHLPDAYELLIIHGGARFQFSMLPANHLSPERTADYLESGHFARAAAVEAAAYGGVHVAASSSRSSFLSIPEVNATRYSKDPAYVHYTSNNTEMGTQYERPPQPPESTWLACDASSDLLTRPFDIAQHGCIYATSHKNLGTAGLALVIMRRDLLTPVRPIAPFMSYATHAAAKSRFNTPPVSTILVLRLMAEWTAANGGVERMASLAEAKSKLLYEALDHSEFYQALVHSRHRSKVNVTFKAPTADLEERFQREAEEVGLVGLWGYRKVGHLRASLFNAVPLEGVERLVDFMASFARRSK